jgi:hypothetical protein
MSMKYGVLKDPLVDPTFGLKIGPKLKDSFLKLGVFLINNNLANGLLRFGNKLMTH